MFLFSPAPGKWIFGETQDSECPSGIFRIEPSTDRTQVSIKHTMRDITLLFSKPISYFLDANGVPYANYAALKTASQGFFDGDNQYPSGKSIQLVSSFNRPANVLDYAAYDVINPLVASVKQKETITFSGTGGTANVTGAGGLTKLATFRDDLTTTAIDFESAHGAAYAAAGITLTRNMADIILEATVAGVPFTAPVVTNVTANLAGTVAHTTANATLAMLTFDKPAVLVNGGEMMIKSVFIEAPAKFANQTFSLRLYNAAPASLLGDNVPFVLDTTNVLKRNGKILVTMDPVINAASVVSGMETPFLSFQAASDSKAIYAYLLVNGAIVAPETAGKFTIILNITQQS